ncbi:PemK-like protein [Paenibacillus alvei]|uniref:hypothetical protein n=1 Tax=Paenibacillus alvei TaxID=44250 RepID=UPI000287A6ED|nr:hypothetical protein [Paenibacillus alvei]EJW13784.1 PemK-like protein [Paenibacillus alvei DSM 29]MCY9540515.1 PemK-like protein [Paenibacillus alvei]MCY9708281.1 PemK-like protein [Paenibacillus alvei]MCY9732924.1 PemK-like protein [Paenibacillus alvei]MCY9755202.1 PemK-like protein [Paenibacillus alvei]
MTEFNFKRGQVYEGNFPELKYHDVLTPRPGYVLHGKHKFVMLQSHDYQGVNPHSVLVLPITSAKAEVAKAHKEGRSVRASYVLLLKEDYPFLDHDSYVSTDQPVAMNRKWFYPDLVGELKEEKMFEVDFAYMYSCNLQDAVMEYATNYYLERLKAESEAFKEVASASTLRNT